MKAISTYLPRFPFGSEFGLKPRSTLKASTPKPAAASADEAIRSALLQRLAGEAWWDADTANVFVNEGVVVFQGLIAPGHRRHPARDLALLQAGVKGVWDARVPRREWQGMA